MSEKLAAHALSRAPASVATAVAQGYWQATDGGPNPNYQPDADEPVAQGGWVKCSERLPEVGVNVLCRCKSIQHADEVPLVVAGLYELAYSTKGETAWFGAETDSRIDHLQVLWWMPLPAATKE